MSFEQEITDKTNLEQYEQLKQQALRINSQCTAWMGQATTLHSQVDVAKQAEIDQMKTDFIDLLKVTFGI